MNAIFETNDGCLFLGFIKGEAPYLVTVRGRVYRLIKWQVGPLLYEESSGYSTDDVVSDFGNDAALNPEF